MDLLVKPIYRLDGVEIDVGGGTIQRDGQRHHLRQQTFQVLLYLLEHRERVVHKQELIENIWRGAAVTDNALVQCIADIRRALGDDSRQPSFVKTLPKLGYRFIGPVEAQSLGAPLIIETEEITSIEIEYKEGLGADRPAPIAPVAAPAPPHALLARFVGHRRLILAAAAGLMATLAFAALIYPGRLLTKSARQQVVVTLPQVEGKRAVAVMYFENLSASRELDWLREGLADMLITDLSRSNRLTVLGRQQLHLLLERFGRSGANEIQLDEALQIAQASGAEVVILGSFASVGDRLHIGAQLYDVRSNQALAAERIVVDQPKEMIGQIDLLSLKLAAHLGAGADVQETKSGLAEAMTNNLEAYRYYSLGLEKAQAVENAEAIALLKRAVALDPQFAMAYARIGYAYGVRWNFAERARPYLERAFQLADRLTDKDRLIISGWYAIANADFPGAIRSFQEIIARYPLEVEAYWRLAHLLQGEERLEEALEVAQRGLSVDAGAKELCNQLGGIYLDLGRFDEAIEMCRRYVALAPAEPNAYDSLGTSYLAVGRYAEAKEAYERALALKPDFEVALIHLANADVQQGRYHEAVKHYQRYIQIAPSELESARGYGAICQVYLRAGELDRAEQAANQEIKISKSSCWNSLLIALQRGETAKVDRLKAQLFASLAPLSRGARETPRFQHYMQGYLEMKSGRAAEAIESFKEALRHRPPYWNIDSLEDCLANAYLEMGRLDDAIAEYERILSANPNYPLAQYHLAQAYERQGRADQAPLAYERFLQNWKEADPDIPEVRAARQRLAGQSSSQTEPIHPPRV